jgi:imidazolonepropionase-like amidohydrolase
MTKDILRARDMAQVVEHLLSKLEALKSSTGTAKKCLNR